MLIQAAIYVLGKNTKGRGSYSYWTWCGVVARACSFGIWHWRSQGTICRSTSRHSSTSLPLRCQHYCWRTGWRHL
ncbi:protein of unknown function [Pseudorhizobium banfieldiae]|uniref:Uncharacterized protein n=1 Tax=Pseudorhizobium banfieldiae TaxID=1125847 RepID=L0NJR9_9HYPH|nr:protein of unknown function [Pseudorhizobium banfieldiae]